MTKKIFQPVYEPYYSLDESDLFIKPIETIVAFTFKEGHNNKINWQINSAQILQNTRDIYVMD